MATLSRKSSAVPVLFVFAGLGVVFTFAGGGGADVKAADAGKAEEVARKHMTFDFRAGIQNFPSLSLEGPDTDEVAKTDAQGLRVTLLAGRPRRGPVVVALDKRLGGDFEITLSYELLSVGEPVPRYGAGLTMRIWFDSPTPYGAILERCRRPMGELFGAHRIFRKPNGKEGYSNIVYKSATDPRGKLRLVRNGSTLRYLAADEGHNWNGIQTLDLGTDDVKAVSVTCTTRFAPVALDVRLTELVIDADRFPSVPKSALPSPTSGEVNPAPKPKKWLLALTLCVAGFLSLGAVGWWFLARQKRRADKERVQADVANRQEAASPAASALSFSCSECGKRLKANAELSGKKIKCPQCGKTVLVPEIEDTEPDSSSA